MSDVEGPSPEVRERLLAATRRAAERTAGETAVGRPAHGDETVSPGDLFVFHATADHDVEWLFTAPHPDDPERALLVPAVTEEGAGSGDVEVPEDEPGGPLQARCRHRLWVPAAMLEPGLRSGRVAPRWAAEAERLCAALEAGPVPATPLRRETDAEAGYRDRDRELAAAREALRRAAVSAAATAPAPPVEAAAPRSIASGPGGRPPAATEPFRRPLTSSVPVLRMAAAFLVVALGLSTWWGLALRGEVAQLRTASIDALPMPITIGTERGEEVETGVVTEQFVWFRLYWQDFAGAEQRVEIVDEAGRVRVSLPLTPQGGDDYILRVPRSRLPAGNYLLRVLRVGDGTETVIDRLPVRVPSPASEATSGPSPATP